MTAIHIRYLDQNRINFQKLFKFLFETIKRISFGLIKSYQRKNPAIKN